VSDIHIGQYLVFNHDFVWHIFLCCQLPYILYHGAKPDRMLLRRDIARKHTVDEDGIPFSFPVVVTSYEIAMNDSEFLMHKPWKLMIIDEGHRIKNFNCRLIRFKLLVSNSPFCNYLVLIQASR